MPANNGLFKDNKNGVVCAAFYNAVNTDFFFCSFVYEKLTLIMFE